MKKLKQKPVIKQEKQSDSEQSASMDDEDEQYDSMIENGTSDEETSENESDMDNATESSADETNRDSGHSENQPETSRKRKQTTTQTPTEKSKKQKDDKKLYKQPTVEEINQLRETENLYHSNLFRMQIQEMLNELRVKDKYKTFTKQWLDEFNTFLGAIKSMTVKEESSNLSFLDKCKVKYPLNMTKLHSKMFQFQFLAPREKAFLIGSADTDTWLGTKLIVDICLPMPAGCFQKENYLNLIYDQKRALYLTYVAHQMIRKKFHSNNLKFNCPHNNPYKPVLEVVPDGKLGERLTFRIYVSGDTESFKLNRFVPWNSNIRDSLFNKSATLQEEEILYATQNYNATVLFDLTMKANQIVVRETIGQDKNLKNGLILLKVWLRQRNLGTGFLGFGNYLMTMLVVYLFKERKIHAAMSSYQIARNVWNYLALSTWNIPDKGITLCSISDQPNQPTMEQLHTYYDIVFVDSTGYLNLCSNLSVDMYLAIKYESQRALDLLNNTKVNSFQALFMSCIPVYTKFDHFIKITNGAVIKQVLKTFGDKADKHNFAGMWYPHIVKLICSILRKGLADRILSLTLVEDEWESWSVNQNPPKTKKTLKFGLNLNRETACDILNKGPQANEPTSEEFRKFWGEKSQLRRFQDGSITEACVWASTTATPSEKRLIVKQIVEYLLLYHFKIENTQLTYIAHQFDVAYSLDKIFYVFEEGTIDAETTTLNIIKKFDDLAKKLRACDDIPLEITSVQGISSVFRYCDPIPILASAKTYNQAGKVVFQSYKVCRGVVQLGLSGKWPNDLLAFRRIKTAFHIQIARTLRDKFKLVTRGDINGVTILNDGYLYKVEIFHQKELALLKKTVSVKGVVQYIDTPESLELEKRLNVMPKLNSFLHGLHQRCSSFGPSVMIAKRWLYSQLLDPYLWPDECTELLIAHLFIKEGSCANPIQPQNGFFRFLEFLSSFDFQSELVLLNFNDEMNHDEIANLEGKFSTDRHAYPPLAIITSFDPKHDCMWSKQSPSPQILGRVVLLARHALQQIQPAFHTESDLPVQQLFIASLDGYDFVIGLNPHMVQSCLAHNFHPLPAVGHRIDATIPAAEFDPIQKGLQELRNGYSEFAVFFYNPCEGKQIAVIWKPECFVERDFKVTNVNGCRIDKDGSVKCNIEQLIEDFRIILKGLANSFLELRAKRIKENS